MAPLLQAENVRVSRPAESGGLRQVLKGASLQVASGEVLAVVGPSGSGKSTLLRLFNRLLEPDHGRILIEGEDVRSFAPPELRARVPLVAQKPFLFAGTVGDNLQTPARMRRAGLPDLESPVVRELLELCQVDPAWINRDARKLSVGQQQRICVARALVGPCQALLLDEPTSALDRPTADLMAHTFRQLARKRNLAIIFVSHDLRLTERCADRVALLLDGAIAEEGPPARVLHAPATEAARAFLTSDPREKGAVKE